MMFKKAAFLFLSALLFLLSAACSSSVKDVALEPIQTEMIAQLSIANPVMLSTPDLLNQYGIQEADVKQSACFLTMTGIFPDEVIMVEAVDAAAAARIEEKLNNRLREVKNQSQSYDPESYEIAQKCEVKKNGNYVSLFISPLQEEMQPIYENYMK